MSPTIVFLGAHGPFKVPLDQVEGIAPDPYCERQAYLYLTTRSHWEPVLIDGIWHEIADQIDEARRQHSIPIPKAR